MPIAMPVNGRKIMLPVAVVVTLLGMAITGTVAFTQVKDDVDTLKAAVKEQKAVAEEVRAVSSGQRVLEKQIEHLEDGQTDIKDALKDLTAAVLGARGR